MRYWMYAQCYDCITLSYGRCTLSVKLSDFTVWLNTWRKNGVNCSVLTSNNAGLRTVISSLLSHRQLRSSLRESHTFLSLPADTTMASFQGTQPSKIMSIAWYIPFKIPLLTPHFMVSFQITLWPMWLANSKQQPCFYPPQSEAQEDTQNWPKNWQTWWEACAVPENIQFSFSLNFFTQLNCRVYLRIYGALYVLTPSISNYVVLNYKNQSTYFDKNMWFTHKLHSKQNVRFRSI